MIFGHGYDGGNNQDTWAWLEFAVWLGQVCMASMCQFGQYVWV